MTREILNGGRETGLKQLPNFRDASKIRKIAYPHNVIQKISREISKAINTEQIDLSFNRITYIQPIYSLPKLKILNLSNNLIRSISKNILKLPYVQDINLSYNLLNGMGAICYIFQLIKSRAGEVRVDLVGNPVVEEFGVVIGERIREIERGIQVGKQKISANEGNGGLKQLQSITSANLLAKPADYSCKKHQKNKISQISLQFMKPTFSVVVNSLNQARQQIEKSGKSLIEYRQKFGIVSKSNLEGWSEELVSIFRKQAKMVDDIIDLYLQIIKLLTTQFHNTSTTAASLQSAIIRSSSMTDQIKSHHERFIVLLYENNTSIKVYKAWVKLYREVRIIIEEIQWLVEKVMSYELRNQEIEKLKIISPVREMRYDENLLEGFLFSRQKQEEDSECSECFIRKQQVKKMRETIDIIKQQNTNLQSMTQHLTTDNQKISKANTMLQNQFRTKQQIIIGQLQQKIDGSVYQKIFLEQAKSIQDLIRCEKYGSSDRDHRNGYGSEENKYHSIYQSASNWHHQRERGTLMKQDVSQFTTNMDKNDGSSTINLKRPYFNKKEDNGVGNREKKMKTKSSMASTEKKKMSKLQKSKQKNHNNIVNSKDRTNIPSNFHHPIKSQFSSGKVPKNIISDESLNEKLQVQNHNIMTSDFLLTETDKQKSGEKVGNNRQGIMENAEKMKNIGEGEKNISNLINNCHAEKQNILMSCNNLNYPVDEQHEKYQPIEYRTINLTNDQPYQHYMRYHLRNSIVEALTKADKPCNISRIPSRERTVKRGDSSTQILSQLSSRILSSRENKKQKGKNQLKKNNSNTKSCRLNKLRF